MRFLFLLPLIACSSLPPEQQIVNHLVANKCLPEQPCTVVYQEADGELVVTTSIDRYEVLPSTQDLGTSLVGLGCAKQSCKIWSAAADGLTRTIEVKGGENRGATVVTDMSVTSPQPS